MNYKVLTIINNDDQELEVFRNRDGLISFVIKKEYDIIEAVFVIGDDDAMSLVDELNNLLTEVDD
ncbi:MAG: hypothetical protein LBC84_06810 [Prevotellaceae bacterium]|jgi:hypothetical protein|nr:hypothetical protein [Prevotellaceae bacterium]